MPPAYVKPYDQAWQDRCERCRGDLRGGDASHGCGMSRSRHPISRRRWRCIVRGTCLSNSAPSLVNMIRGLLAEFGIEIRRGIEQALMLARRIAAGEMADIPALAAKVIAGLAGQVLDLQRPGWGRSNANCWPGIARATSPSGLQRSRGSERCAPQRLQPLSPTPHQFGSGRQFAAWLGLTPLQHSSGGKERLGRISKMGDKYLRRLLVVGMTSLIRRAKYKPEAVDPWPSPSCCRAKPACLGTPSRSPTRRRGWSGRSWYAAGFIAGRQAS